MTTRAALLGLSNVRIGTLHSLCWEILQTDLSGKFGGPALELAESKLNFFVKDTIEKDFRDQGLDFNEAQTVFRLAKAQGLSFHAEQQVQPTPAILAFFRKNVQKHWLAPSYVAVYRKLELFRAANRLMDYDDMLVLAYLFLLHDPSARLLWAARYEYVIVDEAQDSSAVQNAVVGILSETCKNIMHVGDICQSLYRWRGALPEEFVQHANTYEKLVLPVNYRSTQEVCKHATNLTAGETWNVTGPTLPHKDAQSDPASVVGIQYASPEKEALAIAGKIQKALDAGVPPKEIAILYRVTSLMPTIEEALLHAKIPYVVWSGATFYIRKEVRDLLAYLRVASLQDPDGSELRRALLAPFRYIGNKVIGAAEQYARENGVALLDALGKVELGKGQRTKYAAFYKTLTTANKMISRGDKPAKILEFVVEDTHYDTFIKEHDGSDTPDPDGGKAANIFKLISIAENFDSTAELLVYINKTTAEMEAMRGKRDANAVVLSTIHKCVSPDTLVESEWGLIPIKELPDAGHIAHGDGIAGFGNKVAYEERDMLRIQTKNGYTINVTTDHRMVAWVPQNNAYEEVEAKDLTPDMFLRLKLGPTMEPQHTPQLHEQPALQNPEGVKGKMPATMTLEFAKFLGYYLAFGSLTRDSVIFELPSLEALNHTRALVRDVFGCVFPQRDDEFPKNVSSPWTFTLRSSTIATWMRDLAGVQQRTVPPSVLTAPLLMQKAFLSYLMGDAYILHRDSGVASVRWKAPSETVARVVQTMLLRTNVITTCSILKGAWTISINPGQIVNWLKFMEFTDQFTSMRFANLKHVEDTYNLVPVAEAVAKTWPREEWRYERESGLANGYVTRAVALKVGLLEELNFHHDRIVSIEPTKGPAMCIEVPDTGRFLQNGFDGCNSKGLEWERVFGVGWNEGVLPHQYNPDPGEELRLAYVCMTRAKKRFEASCVEKIVTPRGPIVGKPSSFFNKAKLPVKIVK